MFKLNPFIRFAKNFTALTQKNKTSVCYDCRLFFIAKGSGNITINGVSHGISENTALFFPPATHYKFAFDDWNNLDIIVINFDLTDEYSVFTESLGTATEDDLDAERFCTFEGFDEFRDTLTVEDTGNIRSNLLKCCEEFLRMDDYYRERASACLKLCLLEMLGMLRSSESSQDVINRIMRFVYENYGDASLSNKMIADRLNYHPYYISTLMKERTGMTLHRFIIKYRIRLAMDLLVTSNLSIEDITWRIGFTYPSHFINSFKNIVGVTPLKYRNKKSDSYI